ncbi:uncharacterized protein PHACADRAFT_254942 [Phanerochaete carnosa HHB-10118-sp]|uniref:Uncharacterized protein n=1 Tax=Phanerochaete carnosa (strain HHB-10118-sp) TaxID=650164 RepID=K5WDB4_PHACS|nr:uncharacterized protein PHACADRAFT_254942 [Phanerochaete carnosa HHB-10118-sp]EKM57265.1 hypothetical protein PHACADRAFT_254942 [Phanerochaete carnosa HHB-10118-sp]
MCWYSAGDRASLAQIDAVFASYYEFCTTGDFQTFIGRAIARKTVTPDQFVYHSNAKLLADDVVDGELACLMNNLGWFFTHPQMKRSRGLDDEHPLNLLRAAQRQICSGDDTYCEWNIIRHTFSMIG